MKNYRFPNICQNCGFLIRAILPDGGLECFCTSETKKSEDGKIVVPRSGEVEVHSVSLYAVCDDYRPVGIAYNSENKGCLND